MVSKIEAAEALADAVERMRESRGDWMDVVNACDAYRSASVPSDEELGRVAYEARMRGFVNTLEWRRTSQYDREAFARAAAAVREWVQRDGLTDEERQRIVTLIQANEPFQPEIDYSILRKLGREPEPVWEWTEANASDGISDESYWYCQLGDWSAIVSFGYEGIRSAVLRCSDKEATSGMVKESDAWSVSEAKAWCEQQLREARQ